MKKIILTLAFGIGTLVFAQSGPPAGNALKGEFYGSSVSDSSVKTAISATQLEKQLRKTNKIENVAVKGKVAEVCDKKGCWLTVKTNSNDRFFVKMKDYAFFVPLALRGKDVVLFGDAELKMTSVKELQHYAEDAKKSAVEIAMITQPKQEVNFMATGIKVVK